MRRLRSSSRVPGMLSRLFFLLLVFLLLPAAFSFSDVTLTDEEYNQVLMELEKSETALNEANKQIAELKLDLKNSEAALQTVKLGLEMQLAFLKEQKKDQWINNLEWFLIGLAGGSAGGFILGIKVQI